MLKAVPTNDSSKCTLQPRAQPYTTWSQQPLHSCRRSLHQTAKATNWNLNPHPKIPPENNQTKKTNKKNLKRNSCLQDWGQTMLLGLFVDSFAVLTQMEEPNFALPFPHLRNLKKKVHSNHTHSALYITRSHECLRLPVLEAPSFKSEKNELRGFFSKDYLSLRCFLIFQSIYVFILFPGL